MLICIVTLSAFSVGNAFAQEPYSLKIYVDGKYVLTYTEKYTECPNHVILEEVRARKINSAISEKAECVKKQRESGKTEKQALLYCFPYLKDTVAQILKAGYTAPVDSKIFFYPDNAVKFTITKDKSGKRVDETQLYGVLYRAVTASKARADVNTVRVKPYVTVEQNEKFTFVRSSFATNVQSSPQNRKHNIALALSKINGSVILPSQSLSFNTVVGERIEQNGYKSAKIIMDGEYVDGVGGGVCQASTTLYNGALLAGLDATSVSGHSLRPAYIEASFDAMVNSSWSDLVIKNNTQSPMFIKAYCDETVARVIVYGEKMREKIVRKSVVTKTTDPPPDMIKEEVTDIVEEIGTEQRTSYGCGETHSEGYLVYYQNGKKVREKRIRSDAYRKKCGIITKKVGKEKSNEND